MFEALPPTCNKEHKLCVLPLRPQQPYVVLVVGWVVCSCSMSVAAAACMFLQYFEELLGPVHAKSDEISLYLMGSRD